MPTREYTDTLQLYLWGILSENVFLPILHTHKRSSSNIITVGNFVWFEHHWIFDWFHDGIYVCCQTIHQKADEDDQEAKEAEEFATKAFGENWKSATHTVHTTMPIQPTKKRKTRIRMYEKRECNILKTAPFRFKLYLQILRKCFCNTWRLQCVAPSFLDFVNPSLPLVLSCSTIHRKSSFVVPSSWVRASRYNQRPKSW